MIKNSNSNNMENSTLYFFKSSDLSDHTKSTVQLIQFSDMDDTVGDQSLAYISLKEIMPEESSRASTTTMMMSSAMRQSWREIPMKEPLLQQAAWAYLQPIGIDPAADRTLLNKVKDLFGCLSGVLVLIFNRWFSLLSPKKKKLKI
ncbi:hypothetical protein HAX54_041111 [Datura stramonium]|uniref:Uncharacterized protein n=1 Tax=Datura stramonium TaxID=4076 RepID=A0ABS8RQ66_DATST|nr:hypothetical protein [Datura stramonium]